jgi:hypothetical protein
MKVAEHIEGERLSSKVLSLLIPGKIQLRKAILRYTNRVGSNGKKPDLRRS